MQDAKIISLEEVKQLIADRYQVSVGSIHYHAQKKQFFVEVEQDTRYKRKKYVHPEMSADGNVDVPF